MMGRAAIDPRQRLAGLELIRFLGRGVGCDGRLVEAVQSYILRFPISKCQLNEEENIMVSPAESLTGKKLGDWTVSTLLPRSPVQTGGNFSVGYKVTHENGSSAYMKAIDLRKALRMFGGDPIERMKEMLDAFDFERTICQKCRDQRLDRVIRAIADGIAYSDPDEPMTLVPYLIFEMANGDIRVQLDASVDFDLAWALRTLHQITVGLKQLHGAGIAHQDVKPSNVLNFGTGGAKLADLGRASAVGVLAPHDGAICAGQRDYAPPEIYFAFPSDDWEERRKGCDLFQLGSMIVFLFTGASMSAMIIGRMDAAQKVRHADYKQVLPLVRVAFDDAIEEFAKEVPIVVRNDLVRVVKQLCEPDPALRGHPSNRFGNVNRFSLERYISELNHLAARAELNFWGARQA